MPQPNNTHLREPPSSHVLRALSPYIQNLRENSLLLLTETTESSATWLISRIIAVTLARPTTTVIFASWMRRYDFWRHELRRGLGLDLNEYTRAHQFHFLYGLAEFTPKPQASGFDAPLPTIAESASGFENAAVKACESVNKERQIVMVLDGVDMLLGLNDEQADTILTCIWRLRRRVHAMAILLPADIFESDSDRSVASTPLMVRQRQLLLSIAHQADWVLAARRLDTGAARDVTGVLRATGGRWVGNGEDRSACDKEFLYHVDSNKVSVWERGSERSAA